jgi:hypothetical protein
MLSEMTAVQLAEWQAYGVIEPFDEQRADLRAGIIASTIANVNRAPKTDAYKATDFMAFADKDESPPVEQSEAEQIEIARCMQLVGAACER